MSPVRVEFLPAAARDFHRLDAGMQPRITRALQNIGNDPHAGKPLHGPYAGLLSYRVGDYRIVYRLDAKSGIAVIHALGHRRDIYR